MYGTSVAHERSFLVMNRVTEQRPSLMTQLEAVVRESEQSVFGVTNFSFDRALHRFRSYANYNGARLFYDFL